MLAMMGITYGSQDSIEMTEDEIDSGQILISIVDKHLFSSSHIGAYNFDISDLHARTNHEYYTFWLWQSRKNTL